MAKPPTIHDVAGALGMHKSTVSLALSGKGNVSAKTRERVRSVAEEMGYEPNPLAQRLAFGYQNPTVCILSGPLDVGLMTEKILMIQREMSTRSFEIPLYVCPFVRGQGESSQAVQIRQICRQRPRAIVCAAQSLDALALRDLERYQEAGGIVVSYDVPIPLTCDQVIFDREDNAYQAARHLLEAGHRRIGLGMSSVTSWLHGTPDFSQASRLKGFRRALEESGVPIREDWFFENPTYERGGSEMARKFMAMADRPTGLCIVNDYVALAFMVEVMQAGVRIPNDVSIIGHDNQFIAAYCPVSLTSVTHPADKIVHTVVDLLLERLAGSAAAPQTLIITGDLVRRESVMPSSLVL